MRTAARDQSSLPRWLSYGLIGAALAAGAPLGLLAVRLGAAGLWDLHAVRRELQADRATYLYVTVSTALVFASFGCVLGRQADTLLAASRTDALTGIGNRRAFEEGLEQETSRAARYDQPLSLLLVDLDGLKSINDRHGHAAGNAALQAVARALRMEARATDVVARVGGDEFALLAPSTRGAAAAALGERIRALVTGHGVHALTVSVGVATLDGGRASDPRLLCESADRALYAAKRQGRNRTVSIP